jgi:hypothetical protein
LRNADCRVMFASAGGSASCSEPIVPRGVSFECQLLLRKTETARQRCHDLMPNPAPTKVHTYD